ncbi:LOW QUALITY PROTEIN: sperm-associated antigen 1-like [Liolophura sinensis]|uniref:LOW QUALITY PROTEIN: sperm-associated antigen 1-like n=1 Tax=Liolophura sinensis TaxID=3198878 RepID=UPI003158CE2C
MADMCGATRTKKYDIPLSHLDYKYVEGCSDVKELEKILKVLRSGDEGRYPDLERTCEEKIEQLNPDSRVLRKDKPAAQPGDLDKEEWEIISDGIKDFTTEMKNLENRGHSKPSDCGDNLPPVRGSGTKVNTSVKPSDDGTSKQKTAKSVKPRDYREWDRFDVDKELETVEKEDSSSVADVNNALRQSTLPQNLKADIDVSGLTDEEKTNRANREKDKGNEAFRSNDYLEAVVYYTRSIQCVPLPASYNNRALAYIKLSKWPEAVADCNRVLEEETDNVKGNHLRRGTAYKGLKDYHKAQRDFEKVLELEPNEELLGELGKDKAKEEEEEKEERKQKGRRMMIEEVEGSESEEEGGDKITPVINETTQAVETDSDLVNGHADNSATETEHKTDTAEYKTDSKSASESKSDSESKNEGEVQTECEAKCESAKEDTADGGVLSTGEMTNPEGTGESFSRPVLIQHPLPTKAGELRELGNSLFRSGQYGDAIAKYTTAIDLIVEEGKEQTVNLSLLHSNRAACKLKVGDCAGAIEDCTEALRRVPHSIKPLLRRAQAYETTERYSKAYVDFKHVLSIDNSYDIAFQGASRSSQMLQQQDGPKWREKLPEIPRVLSSDVPIIQSLSSPSSPGSSSTLQSPDIPPSNADLSPGTTASANMAEKTAEEESKPLSPEEEFNSKKAEGNQLVQKGEFRSAEECYCVCVRLFPARAVGFTNRALCYLRLNEPAKAEVDCTTALDLEPQNVKALFRRAQARKMLSQYKDSLSDLTQLLKLEGKNSAARRELDLVKQYYREELEKLKASKTPTSSSNKEGAKSDASEKSSKKTRKRMIIEEVEDDTNESPGTSSGKGGEKRHDLLTATLVMVRLMVMKPTKTTKPKTKKIPKKSGAKSSSAEMKAASEIATQSGATVKVPKLIKVTPYEFMQAWNSLKSVTDTEAYAKLLEQVPPGDIATVISNKLDASMLSKIIASASEYFIPHGRVELAYKFLSNLCKVSRFQTISMFMSAQEKQELSAVFDKIAAVMTEKATDIEKLRGIYGLKS